MVYFPDLKKEVNSKVSFSSRIINPRNRTFNVEAPLDSAPAGLSPNMVAVLKISDYSNDSSMVIPIDLIQRSGEGNYIMVAERQNGKLIAVKRKIETGKSYGGFTEVVSGISTTDQVITNGYRDLNEDEELRTN